MQRQFKLLFLSTVLVSASVAAYPQNYQVDKIIPIQNSRGINQTYLRPLPLGPLLNPSQSASDWQLLIQNEFRQAFPIREDGETYRIRYTHRIASRQGEWQLAFPLIHRGGGVLDPFINWWHISVVDHRAPQRERTAFGLNSFRLHDGTQVSAGTGFGDLVASYSFRAPGQPQISLKLPTGNPNLLLGSGGFDLGISAEKTWQIAPNIDFTTHASLIYQSQSPLWSDTNPWIPAYTFALAYSPSQTQSWIVQLTNEAAPVKSRQPYLDQTNRIITFGYSQATKNGTWTYWLSEDGDVGQFNLNGNVNVGADFSIGIRFTQKQ
jgi:hypothetical protein